MIDTFLSVKTLLKIYFTASRMTHFTVKLYKHEAKSSPQYGKLDEMSSLSSLAQGTNGRFPASIKPTALSLSAIIRAINRSRQQNSSGIQEGGRGDGILRLSSVRSAIPLSDTTSTSKL